MANPNGFAENLTPYPPGTSGNLAGRKTAGASMREHINAFAEAELNEADLRTIARDRNASFTKRAAAERVLRTMEAGDIADMEDVLHGGTTLRELRAEGVNTEVVKKMKVKTRQTESGTEIEREIELHDRAGQDFDRIFDRTEGKPKQTIDTTVTLPQAVAITTPLTRAAADADDRAG